MKHPVDVSVGKRVRHRRWMLGMTQQQLAEKVGTRFQQIQKYESGANRISASRLWDIANAMNVSIEFFFEGLTAGENAQSAISAASVSDPAVEREAIELVKSYASIPSEQRRGLLDLARVLSEVA